MYEKHFPYFNFNGLYFLILFISFLISSLGIVVIYSASGGMLNTFFYKQILSMCIFLCVAIIVSTVHFRFFYKGCYYIYLCCLLLLIWAAMHGHQAMGAQRWIQIGVFNLQPSEITKITLIIVLARYFDRVKYHEINSWSFLSLALLIIAAPVVLILKQPNLGMAMVITSISGLVFFCIGVSRAKFLLAFLLILILAPIIWHYFLYDYQKTRVMMFFNPESDILGSGYNVIQSKIAIGSGQMFGKGLLRGSQSQLGFLPEKHTDFIFSLLAEEFGFIGVLLCLFLYIILIILLYMVAMRSESVYGTLLSIGIASMLCVQIFINLGMISGLLPVVGIPLPLMSYGGSNLSTTFVGIGLVLGVLVQNSSTK